MWCSLWVLSSLWSLLLFTRCLLIISDEQAAYVAAEQQQALSAQASPGMMSEWQENDCCPPECLVFKTPIATVFCYTIVL